MKNAIREKQILKEKLELNRRFLSNLKEVEIKKLLKKQNELRANLKIEQEHQLQLQEYITNL